MATMPSCQNKLSTQHGLAWLQSSTAQHSAAQHGTALHCTDVRCCAPVAVVHAVCIRLQLHHAALVPAAPAPAAATFGGTPLGSRRAPALLGRWHWQLQIDRLALVVLAVAHVAQHCQWDGRMRRLAEGMRRGAGQGNSSAKCCLRHTP